MMNEKQIAEWAENLADSDLWNRPARIEAIEKAARTLVSAVRKETRGECARDAERYRHIRKRAYVAGNGWMFGGSYKPIAEFAYNLRGKAALEDCDAAIDAAIRNLQEREEGK